jgi:hypothetical protein
MLGAFCTPLFYPTADQTVKFKLRAVPKKLCLILFGAGGAGGYTFVPWPWTDTTPLPNSINYNRNFYREFAGGGGGGGGIGYSINLKLFQTVNKEYVVTLGRPGFFLKTREGTLGIYNSTDTMHYNSGGPPNNATANNNFFFTSEFNNYTASPHGGSTTITSDVGTLTVTGGKSGTYNNTQYVGYQTAIRTYNSTISLPGGEGGGKPDNDTTSSTYLTYITGGSGGKGCVFSSELTASPTYHAAGSDGTQSSSLTSATAGFTFHPSYSDISTQGGGGGGGYFPGAKGTNKITDFGGKYSTADYRGNINGLDEATAAYDSKYTKDYYTKSFDNVTTFSFFGCGGGGAGATELVSGAAWDCNLRNPGSGAFFLYGEY